MNKVLKRIIFLVFLLLLLFGFYSVGRSIYIRYTGEKVIAIVSKIPASCDKYNHIKVTLNGVEYEVSISRTDCNENVYRIGQNVTLLKNKKYDELVWPESQIEFLPLVFIVLFVLIYISNKDKPKRKLINKKPHN